VQVSTNARIPSNLYCIGFMGFSLRPALHRIGRVVAVLGSWGKF
jgi:hypothetical protein